MSGHSGIVMNEVPVVCGGSNGTAYYDVKCFHFEKATRKWKRVIEIPIKNAFIIFYYLLDQ